MLGGVAIQFAATTVAMFIAARITSQFRYHVVVFWLLQHIDLSTFVYLVGFGLTFCLNAAPLLLIELAYPTQVGHSLVVSSIYRFP